MTFKRSRSAFISVHLRLMFFLAVGLASGASVHAQAIPPLPDSTGWGVHVLAVGRDAQGSIWVGTYGQGIYRLPFGATTWQPIRHDSTATSISHDFIQALAFGSRGEVWYGTVGNGWGLSTDNGATWKNWTFAQLGPEWQYVAPSGIVVRGDTTVIGTADGLQVTTNNGTSWTAIGDATGPRAKGPADSVFPVLKSEYVRRAATDRRGWTVATLKGNQRVRRTDTGWVAEPLAFTAFPPTNAMLIGNKLIRGARRFMASCWSSSSVRVASSARSRNEVTAEILETPGSATLQTSRHPHQVGAFARQSVCHRCPDAA